MSSAEKSVDIQNVSKKNTSIKSVRKDAPKRRASLACLACRKRKVRCDLTSNLFFDLLGNPICSNCMTNGISCLIGESMRKASWDKIF
ncbi:hypothetical protein GcM1_218064 [Golovinomyces cichoracearum]|uniref:Zn(2)-C6 fungal-type domain-containing protein n=1 Tax=Golovinomyces cichoracearum TaxID=62708 RepID=A0A420ISU7_9PEZI|nr:hypothetical protein GcM1_218064 [Golovinomyces cichoracearum]